jgi:membrane protease YdiL (CAAX protease family)
MLEALRLWAPPLLGVLAAFAFDRASARRGLRPPGFADPLRRAPFLALLALVLAFGVFAGLATLGESGTVDFSAVDPLQLFLLHLFFLAALAAWYGLGWGGLGLPPGSHRRELAAQLGLRSGRLDVELGIGVLAGVAGWVAVLAIMVAVGLGLFALGGQEVLPDAPPPAIVWIAGLPVAVRLALAVSAGVVEELFFRGFLQPRVGLAASSALFVLAHLSYDQPLMLVGITLLSLFYGALVRWRQSLWSAIVAHTLFDAIQLLVVIPLALRFVPAGASG